MSGGVCLWLYCISVQGWGGVGGDDLCSLWLKKNHSSPIQHCSWIPLLTKQCFGDRCAGWGPYPYTCHVLMMMWSCYKDPFKGFYLFKFTAHIRHTSEARNIKWVYRHSNWLTSLLEDGEHGLRNFMAAFILRFNWNKIGLPWVWELGID